MNADRNKNGFVGKNPRQSLCLLLCLVGTENINLDYFVYGPKFFIGSGLNENRTVASRFLAKHNLESVWNTYLFERIVSRSMKIMFYPELHFVCSYCCDAKICFS